MLNFIGNGAAFNTALGNNNAYRKEGSHLFLIDCGSTNFSRLIERNLLDGIEEITVLQTHLHSDHVGSLGDLIGYAFYILATKQTPKVTILAPEALKEDLQNILQAEGITDDQYDLTVLDDKYEPADLPGITSIETYEVTHVPHLRCFAYLFVMDGKTVYYSGDCNMIPEAILEKLLSGEIDVFYQDTSKADFEGNVHLSLRKLSELVPPEKRNIIHCMHLDVSFSVEEAKALGYQVTSVQ